MSKQLVDNVIFHILMPRYQSPPCENLKTAKSRISQVIMDFVNKNRDQIARLSFDEPCPDCDDEFWELKMDFAYLFSSIKNMNLYYSECFADNIWSEFVKFAKSPEISESKKEILVDLLSNAI